MFYDVLCSKNPAPYAEAGFRNSLFKLFDDGMRRPALLVRQSKNKNRKRRMRDFA